MWSYLLVSLIGALIGAHSHHDVAGFVAGGSSNGAIAGQVYYLRGGAHAPIGGADVCLTGGAHVVTDRRGHFLLPDLPPGAYRVTVTQTHFRLPATADVSVAPGKTAAMTLKMGQTYYLGVGIANYTDRDLPRLVAPVHDAKALLTLLAQQFWGDTQLLTNREATKPRILAALQQIAAGMTADDYFVFYFSGHGGSDKLEDEDGKWVDYLIPADDNAKDYTRVICEDELVSAFGKLPNLRHVLVVLDSCYAGEFVGGQSSHAREAGVARTLGSLGCTVLAAADTGELSTETDDGSLFTSYLIEALSGACAAADANHDHAVTATEAFHYAEARTTVAAKEFSEVQHPQMTVGDDLVLRRY